MKRKISIILLIIFEVIFLLTAANCSLFAPKPSTPNGEPQGTPQDVSQGNNVPQDNNVPKDEPQDVTPPKEEEKEEYEKVDGKLTLSTRGVWHRPNCMGNETTLEGICDVLDTFADVGINLVFLESFYHGMAMYRSQYVSYYSGFAKYNYGDYKDYLTAFVAEAAKRGIQVHAWVEDFYIGVNENYFTRNLPDWLLVNAEGSVRQTEGDGYLFLDPANADVRAYLIKIYREMLTAVPNLAGINLDYIRYPVSSTSDDTGFTATAMEQFAEIHSLTLSGEDTRSQFISQLKSKNLYSKWTEFRAGCVTQFVREVSETVRKSFPSAVISTAVFPSAATTYNTKKQDFATWINEGYIDVVTPMAYYDNSNTLKTELSKMLAACDNCYCYAGLSTMYHSLPVADVLKQIEVCSQVGADGVVFFGSQYLLGNAEYIAALKKSDASVKSVVAHDKALYVVNAVAQSVEAELNKNGEASQATEFCEKLNAIKTLLPDNVERVQVLQGQVDELIKSAEQLSSSSRAQVKAQLQYLNKLLELRLKFLQCRQ